MDKAQQRSIIELFNIAVKEFPDRIAIKTENTILTYKELDKTSDQIAFFILENRISLEPFVIFMKPDAYSIATVLGILKSRNYCVLPNVFWPEEKIGNILQFSKSQIVFTDKEYHGLIKKIHKDLKSFKIINIDDFFSQIKIIERCKKNKLPKIYPSDPALVLFTSGTTGDPKGIIHNHQNFAAWYDISNTVLKYDKNDRMCSFFTSFAFLIVFFVIFSSLFSGSMLFIFPPRKNNQMDLFVDNKITILSFAASSFREFIQCISENYKAAETKKMDWIRVLCLGGEAVYKKDIQLFRKYFNSRSLVSVGYCLTEFPFISRAVIKNNTELDEDDNIPMEIIPGVNVKLLGNGRKIIKEIGEKGEIVVQSKMFACKEWPAARENSNLIYSTNQGTTFYTGDLGKWAGENKLELSGRNDFLVKIKGLKVSLEELQNRLYEYKTIKNCVLRLFESKNKEKKIVLYYTSNRPIGKENIIRYLKKKIPQYCLPHYYIYLEKMPLGKNGKINYAKLIKPKGL